MSGSYSLLAALLALGGCRAEAEPPADGDDDDTSTPAPTGCPGAELTVYPDEDGDGFGLEAGEMLACEVGPDEVTVAGDCDDNDPLVHPGAEDAVYDGVDGDCAGDTDFDADGDGHDRVPEGDDCDDADPDVGPDTTLEDVACDGVDQDCDGEAPPCELDIAALSIAWTGDPGDAVGSSVSFVGDVSGDGLEDVYVGALGRNSALDQGAAAIVFGPASTPGLLWDVAGAVFDDPNTPEDADIGRGAAAAGDVDGDGYGDVWIGGSFSEWLFRGPLVAGTTYLLEDAVATVGHWGDNDVKHLGGQDLDGDGYSELVLGPISSYGVYVLDGPFSGSIDANTSSTMTIVNPGCINAYGELLTFAGDTDGDGVGELLVAEDGACFVPNVGKPALVPGDRTGTVNTATDGSITTFAQPISSGVTSLDHTGDGYSDLVMVIPTGLVVLPGPFPVGEVDAFAAAITTFPGFIPLTTADVDGDDQSELVLTDGYRLGLLSGSKSGALSVADVEYWISVPEGGIPIATGGPDVDGDGFDDVMVGSLSVEVGGMAWLLRGGQYNFSL